MRRSVLFAFILIFGVLELPAQEAAKPPAKELTQYIRDAQKAGFKDAQIQQDAVKAGWTEQLVTEAMDYVRGAPKVQPAKPDSQPPASPEPGSPKTAVEEGKPTQTPVQGAPTAPPNAEAQPSGGGAPAPAGSVKPAVPNRGVPDEYRIGEGDVLGISVWGEPAASVGSVVVRPDGIISMPLIKDVRVAGMTPAEAEKNITELLSKQIRA